MRKIWGFVKAWYTEYAATQEIIARDYAKKYSKGFD